MTTFLVSGANGKLGRQVTQLLLDSGAGAVIAASRDPSKLADLAARGAETRRADFDDPASLNEAFKGVDRLLLISTDSLGAGQRLAQHKNAVAAARAAGVKHIVYTSMPKPETSAVSFASDHL
ncbi:MAG: NAD(P)H-binding protein, partial [Asticcacaulis sp.]